MLLRTLSWAASCAIALGTVSGLVYAEDEHGFSTAANNPTTCVELHERVNNDARAVEFLLESHCDADFACTMTWTVTCDNKTTGAGNGSTELARGTTSLVTASAATCNGEWEVRDPKWACNPKTR
jgi:hypothetical protein